MNYEGRANQRGAGARNRFVLGEIGFLDTTPADKFRRLKPPEGKEGVKNGDN